MNPKECEDRIAELLGWKREDDDYYHAVWVKGDIRTPIHPVPNNLDSVAGLMPKGIGWSIHRRNPATSAMEFCACWWRFADGRDGPMFELLGDAGEVDIRTRLLLAVLEAEAAP